MKVHIVSDGVEWDAIYKDGELIHWHDSPSAFDLLYMLGVDVTWEQDNLGVLGNGYESAPRTIEEYQKKKKDHLLKKKIGRARSG